MTTATLSPVQTRQATAEDVSRLPSSLEKVLTLIKTQPRNVDQLRLFTATKHPARRILELEKRGFLIHRPIVNGRLYYAFRNEIRVS